jgi:hypothetical protein
MLTFRSLDGEGTPRLSDVAIKQVSSAAVEDESQPAIPISCRIASSLPMAASIGCATSARETLARPKVWSWCVRTGPIEWLGPVLTPPI